MCIHSNLIWQIQKLALINYDDNIYVIFGRPITANGHSNIELMLMRCIAIKNGK